MKGMEGAAQAETGFRIKDLADSADLGARWDDFVRRHERASIYHLSRWGGLIRELYGHETHYLCAEAATGGIAGILPMVRLKSCLFGDYLVSMPYFNYGGAVGVSAAVEEALMARACELGRGCGIEHIEFRDSAARGTQWPVRTDKVTMGMSLPATSEELWAKVGAKVRAQVKRPAREGVAVRHGGLELLDDFYNVFSRNMRDLGTPVYPKRFFRMILDAFADAGFITVVRRQDRPVAAAFLLGFRGRLEVPWASSVREANSIGVNMLLYWEVLKRAIDSGYRWFDFGRSTRDSGTYRFKRQWGAEPTQLYWHYWLRDGKDIPKLNPENSKYRLAIGLWQRIPVSVANWLGPHLVKSLP